MTDRIWREVSCETWAEYLGGRRTYTTELGHAITEHRDSETGEVIGRVILAGSIFLKQLAER